MYPQRLAANEQLIRIYYKPPAWIASNTTEEHMVVFLGTPSSLYAAVQVSRWRPHLSWLSPNWPEIPTLFFNYIVSFSVALALINAMPVYYLDGQHAIEALAEAAVLRRPPFNQLQRWIQPCVRGILYTHTALLIIVLAGTMLSWFIHSVT
jgi:membrane-associated protease RseP (regulator of RpoE activity)